MLKRIYEKLPVPAQHAACSVYSWNLDRKRFDCRFHDLLAAGENRLAWPADRLAAFRDERLRAFVRHAAETVPYYRRLFAEQGIDPDGIRTMADLKSIPILSRRDAVGLGRELRSEAAPPRGLKTISTSGTTGAGFRFATTLDAYREQWAVWWRHWRGHGIRLGTWCGVFNGKPVVPLNQTKPPFWRFDFSGRRIFFSVHHLSERFLPHTVQEIRKRRLAWIHGRPSTLSLIAAYMVDSGDRLDHPVRWVTTGIEQLFPHQAAMIEKAFGVAPVEHYGMVEAIANISRTPDGRLRIDEDFAALEFIPDDDHGDWRIVGTNFTNLATPLIRYDIGDRAKLSGPGAPANRNVVSLEGRRQDYVVLADGRKIAGLDRLFTDIEQISEAQVVQHAPGQIRIDVVKRPNYTRRDEDRLCREVRLYLGADMQLDIKYVGAIKGAPSGKFQLVDSVLARI